MSYISKGPAKGEDWEYKLYFDPDSDDPSVSPHKRIKPWELMSKLKGLVGIDEKIDFVTICKEPLYEWQFTQYFMYHMYVVFKTENWMWTIEKHSDGITLQRSKSLIVTEKYRRHHLRKSVRERLMSDGGRISVHQLIEWLSDNDQLKQKYCYIFSNCKDFAREVFNRVAKFQRIFW